MVIIDKEEYPYFLDMVNVKLNYTELKDPISSYNISEKWSTSFYNIVQLYGVYMSFYTSKIYNVQNEEAFNNNNFAVMNDQFINL